MFRPVLVIGPLAECVTEKLIQDFPDKFTRCIPEVMHCPLNMMEKGISENIFVDFRKKGSNFECTTVTAVKEICDKVIEFPTTFRCYNLGVYSDCFTAINSRTFERFEIFGAVLLKIHIFSRLVKASHTNMGHRNNFETLLVY